MDETILALQETKKETIKAAVGEKDVPPKPYEIWDALYEDGHLDNELLTRLEDISDDEGDAADGGGAYGDGDSDDEEDDSGDEGSDDDDDDDFDTDVDVDDSDYQHASSEEAYDEGSEDADSDEE
jgi:hypothetical protein